MLSKLPWQKRSNRSKNNSIGNSPESPGPGFATQSQGTSPSASSSSPSQASIDQQAQQRPSGLLPRSRSQRFSRQSLTEGLSRLTSNRLSYVAPSSSQHPFGSEEAPPSIPHHPDITPQRTLAHTESSRNLRKASQVSSIFTPQGNHRGESLSAIWSPGQLLPPSSGDSTPESSAVDSDADPMTTRTASTQGKSSSESNTSGLDRWSQRRLQRLNTEQGFREQRQGASAAQPGYNNTASADQTQPHSSNQASAAAYQRPQTQPSYGAAASPPPPLSAANSPSFPYHDGPPQVHIPTQATHSPPEATTTTTTQNYLSHATRHLQSSRSFSQTTDKPVAASTDSNNSYGHPQTRAANRQSVHANGTGMNPNPNPSTQNAQPAPTSSAPAQHTPTQVEKVGRSTPQIHSAEDMSDEDVNQLIADHKELREKYNKVKKYYFEKEDQVKTLQNSLAHQKISQSRTSLDDSEYATRFNRLDGLIAQLSFSIRKSWKTVPSWLTGSINKDAITIGKQEMTAAGRAIVSQWLVEEVFGMYFHPDLDITLSAQLKAMQKNIRRFAAAAQTQEDEEYLTSKIVTWRLTTLEGLQEMLRSPQCANNRAELIDMLKRQLMAYLQQHLENPPMSDLEGGVHMIIELAVAMVAHLPLESRDVQIEYFQPGSHLNYDQMKPESGILSLSVSLADEAADRASLRSSHSDANEENKSTAGEGSREHRKRDMLSALTGGGKKRDPKNASTSSVDQPHAQSVEKEEPRVRMAVGIAAFVRNRTVLVKAPVFVT